MSAQQQPNACQLSAPATIDELLRRARALAGKTVEHLAQCLQHKLPATIARGKGLVGVLVERALGASAGNSAQPDFPQLGVELKTVPLDEAGRVREATYVCSLNLRQVCREEWAEAHVRRKLRCVLWIPLEWQPQQPLGRRRFGSPVLWSPNAEEEALLRADWTELVGRIALGGIDEVTAHLGRALQIRPKAPNARARAEASGPEGERLLTVPRGFYLRARFTEAVLWRASAPPPGT